MFKRGEKTILRTTEVCTVPRKYMAGGGACKKIRIISRLATLYHEVSTQRAYNVVSLTLLSTYFP